MTIPAWPKLALHNDVLLEPALDDTALAVWLKGKADSGFQYWERIGTVARARIVVEDGICATIHARRRLVGLLGRLLQRFDRSTGNRTWILPNGDSTEQWGERKTDLMLAWSEDGAATLDTASVKVQWPQCEQVQQIGKNLFVIRGVQPSGASRPNQVPPEGQPREIAEQALVAARQAGDRRKEAAALTDLGVLSLNNGNAQAAVTLLDQALTIARELGDQSREADVLGNLGMAALATGDCRRAFELFQKELASARALRDPFAEKLALEHLGIVNARRQDFATAASFFVPALALARQVRDQRQETTLLWHLAILHAELGQRDQAIAVAEASLDLLRSMGKPEASWFAEHLSKYRMGEPTHGVPAVDRLGGSADTWFGESFMASTWTTPTGPETARQPSFLRMAVTATKAMAKFVGSGGKKVAPELRQARLQTCATCEHHTGVRCRLCGCFTNTKSWLPYEDCPLKKWPS